MPRWPFLLLLFVSLACSGGRDTTTPEGPGDSGTPQEPATLVLPDASRNWGGELNYGAEGNGYKEVGEAGQVADVIQIEEGEYAPHRRLTYSLDPLEPFAGLYWEAHSHSPFRQPWYGSWNHWVQWQDPDTGEYWLSADQHYGEDIQFAVAGYEPVTVIAVIARKDRPLERVERTFHEVLPPPPVQGLEHRGVMGFAGDEAVWDTFFRGQIDEVGWELGGGASPNTTQGTYSLPTTLGAPGRYTANYAIRNRYGISGRHQVEYWIAPPVQSTVVDPVVFVNDIAMQLVDDRIRMLVMSYSTFQYCEAKTANPQGPGDWQLQTLPFDQYRISSSLAPMVLGWQGGRPLILGGRDESVTPAVPVYWYGASASPAGQADWFLGSIPEAAGEIPRDIECWQGQVAMLAVEGEALRLVHTDSPTLASWEVTPMTASPSEDLYRYTLLLSEAAPVVLSLGKQFGQPDPIRYRRPEPAALSGWQEHVIAPTPEATYPSSRRLIATLHQGRPLVMTTDGYYSTLVCFARLAVPRATSDWRTGRPFDQLLYRSLNEKARLVSVQDHLLVTPADVLGRPDIYGADYYPGSLLAVGDPLDASSWRPLPLFDCNYCGSSLVEAGLLTPTGAAFTTYTYASNAIALVQVAE